jgi:hypothetical protein
MVRAQNGRGGIASVVKARRKELLETWLENIRSLPRSRTLQLVTEKQLRKQTADLLRALTLAFSSERYEDIERPEFADSVAILCDISASRAEQGATPRETATYLLSLKDALLQYLQAEFGHNPELLNAEIIKMNKVIDQLVMVTFETFVETREEVIAEQGRSLRVREGLSGICSCSKDALESASLDEILLAIADSLCELTGYSVAKLLARRKYQYPTPTEYHQYEAQTVERFLGTETAAGPILLTLSLQEDQQEGKEERNGQEIGSR